MTEQKISQYTQSDDENSTSLVSTKEILSVLKRRKYSIIIIISISVIYMYLNFKLQTPQYRGIATVMITRSNASPYDTFFNIPGETRKDIVLIKTLPIGELTVKELLKMPEKDTLEFFGRRHTHTRLKEWFSKYIPFYSIQSETKRKNTLEHLSDERIRQYAMTLNSRTQVESIPETSLLEVSVISPFRDEATLLANTLCQAYRKASITRNSERYMRAYEFLNELLRQQSIIVDNVDKQFASYMNANGVYDATANIPSVVTQLNSADSKYIDLMTEYNLSVHNLKFLEKQLTQSDKELSERISTKVNAQLANILQEIKPLETEYVRLMLEKGKNNSDVQNIKQQLDSKKARYEQLTHSKIAGEISSQGRAQKNNFNLISEKLQIERKLDQITYSAAEYMRLKKNYEEKIAILPKKQLEYFKLQRDTDIAKKTYISIKEKLEETRLKIASEVGEVSIIGTAYSPYSPYNYSPNKSIASGFILGGILCFIYIIISELLDDTIKDEMYFKHYDYKILSVIPYIYQYGERSYFESNPGLKNWWDRKIILYNKIYSLFSNYSSKPGNKADIIKSAPLITQKLFSRFSESFRMLRTSLNYACIDNTLKTIVVSGTTVGEGKSTICANISIAYALSGKKTLLVDCDLRLASQHKIFKIQREQGLTDYLFSEKNMIDESFFKPTSIDNLFILTAGKKIPNPNEILGSNKMQLLINELNEKFDKVFFDSPPMFLSDAAQLSHSVDGILLTARLNYTERKPIKDLVVDSYLHSHIIGIALIDTHKQKPYGYGRYGYGRYGYGRYGYGRYGYNKYFHNQNTL